MNEEPIKAAELVRNAPRKLARYSPANATLTRLSGYIEDVRTIESNDAWIVVRPVDGLPEHVMGTATIPDPRPEIDKILEKAGQGGRIALVGVAVASTDEIAKLRMTSVHTVNGVATARPAAPGTPRPKPPRARRRWWQWWRPNNATPSGKSRA